MLDYLKKADAHDWIEVVSWTVLALFAIAGLGYLFSIEPFIFSGIVSISISVMLARFLAVELELFGTSLLIFLAGVALGYWFMNKGVAAHFLG